MAIVILSLLFFPVPAAAADWTAAVEEAQLTADDGAVKDYLGVSISVSGDTAVAGAPRGNSKKGAAYVFVRSGDVWSQQARLIAVDGNASDFFGQSVSISGDTVLVGASNSNDNDGAVYVFVRSGGIWSQQAKLVSSDPQAGNGFGAAVYLSGETAFIGEPGNSKVWIFTRSGASWNEQASLTGDAINERFGECLWLNGGTLAVGADGADSYSGATYVFTGSGTSWSKQARLTASDRASGDNFGYRVSVEGDTALIGANLADGKGKAYIFTRSGNLWNEQAILENSEGKNGDGFGYSVSLSRNTAFVGAPGNGGAVHIFTRSGTAWNKQGMLADSENYIYFGNSLYREGNRLFSGDALDNYSRGKVYVYYRETEADLAVEMAASSEQAITGVFLTYNIEVTNNGPDDALAVSVDITLPPSVSLISSDTHGDGTYSEGVWSGFDLDNEASAGLTLTVRVADPDLPVIITGTAGVSSEATDPEEENDNAQVSTLVGVYRGIVGGEVAGVNKTALALPWLALAIILLAGVVSIRQRKGG